MPFTAAHPAIVLPLNYLPKRFVSLSALIIGSMAPDFEYFIRMRTKAVYGHEPLGILYFDLPLVLFVYIVYHLFIKDILIDNLPIYLNRRFSVYKSDTASKVTEEKIIIIIICIIIGATTHLFWDAFTHPHGYFVSQIPMLSQHVLVRNLTIPVYKILQHSSTLFGVLVILYAIKQLPHYAITKHKVITSFWIKVLIVASIVFGIRMLFIGLNIRQEYSKMIVSGISSVIIGLSLVSIYETLSLKKV